MKPEVFERRVDANNNYKRRKYKINAWLIQMVRHLIPLNKIIGLSFIDKKKKNSTGRVLPLRVGRLSLS